MTDKKLTKRRAPRETTAARRAAILEGALICFDHLGIEATTIRDIQKSTNCSVGSLYHHFGSKEGIAEELFIEGIQRFNDGMIRKLKRSATAESSVKDVVRFYCEWSARNRRLARYLHSRNIDFSEEARARLKDIHTSYINEVFRLFTDHVLSGEMRALPLDSYVPLISGPVQEFTRRWLSGQSSSGSTISEDMRELFADAAWKAVRNFD